MLRQRLTPGTTRVPTRRVASRLLTAAAVATVVALLPPSLAAPPGALAAGQGFNYTGSEQTFVVPAGVTAVTVTAHGAAGGSNICNSVAGGEGGTTTATISVTPGETLYVYVGSSGGPGQLDLTGSGGVNGDSSGGGNGQIQCGGGGGASSDVRQGGTGLADRVVVAGGGGGAGGGAAGGVGGAGGGTTGGAGGVGGGSSAAGGGTQSAGGAGGVDTDVNGSAGSLGAGGDGASGIPAGGGGGGGYYGGGGGGSGDADPGGGGGGGSSYAEPSATNVTMTQGGWTGDGSVTISYFQPTTTVVTSSRNPSTYGQSVTLTATISGGDVPTGTVDFEDSGLSISGCSAQAVSHSTQKATCTTSSLDARTHSIAAVYSGDSFYATSTSDPLSQVVNPVEPGAPTIVSAVSGEDSQVPVTWAAPSSTGGFIDYYTVTAEPGGNTCLGGVAPLRHLHALPQYSCTVTGLTNGTQYSFTVTATNGAGTGPASAAVTATPGALPAAPATPTAVAGDGQATVSWSLPLDLRHGAVSPIEHYTVTSSPGGKTCTHTVVVGAGHASATLPSYSCTVTGLTNGTAYTFTVTATNSIGTGPASAPSNSVVPAGVPLVSGTPTATAGDGQATVTWDAFDANGAAVSGYRVTSSPGGKTCTVDINIQLRHGSAQKSYSCTVEGLTNGTKYTFALTATNRVGTSKASVSNAVTPAAVPGAPRNVKATAGEAAAKVTWSPPADDGGSAVTKYSVTSKPGGKTCSTTGAISCTVEGLTPGTSYTFTVRATNGAGPGPASEASNAVTPTCVPQNKVGSVSGQLACGATVSTGSGSGSASVTVPPGATSGGVDVKLNDVTDAPPAGVTTFSAGSTVLDLTVRDLKSGVKITKFAKPLVLHFPAPVSGVPSTSQDGKTWTPLPELKHPSLPAGQKDGYYVEKDGSVDIYTRHATYFGVMKPAAPVVSVQVSKVAWLKLAWTPGSGGGPVSGYLVLGPDGTILETTKTSALVYSHVFKGKYPATLQVIALDAAGDRSAVVQTFSVTLVPRPKSLPHRIPRWAQHLLLWQRHLRHGARPHTPATLPHWYAVWKHWRLHLLRLSVG